MLPVFTFLICLMTVSVGIYVCEKMVVNSAFVPTVIARIKMIVNEAFPYVENSKL